MELLGKARRDKGAFTRVWSNLFRERSEQNLFWDTLYRFLTATVASWARQKKITYTSTFKITAERRDAYF
jgi:hypothetical protein